VSGADGPGRALDDLLALAARLRRECPWDREQTARTIVPHTVEEAYEVADAALAGEDGKLVDELGDLVFQAVFLPGSRRASGACTRSSSGGTRTCSATRRSPRRRA
jgi:NTP pyrophosphatase (non-canonical NTP hydrolase)